MDMIRRSREACESARAVMTKAVGYIDNIANFDSRFDYRNKVRYPNKKGMFCLIGVTYDQITAFVRLYNQTTEDAFNKTLFREKTTFDYDSVVAFGEVANTPEAVYKNLFKQTHEGWLSVNAKLEPVYYTHAKHAAISVLHVLGDPLYIIGVYEHIDSSGT